MINKKFDYKLLLIKYPYLTIGFFVTIFFIVCAIYLPIQFEENDDITMLMLASGKYSGHPDFHLVFIKIFYGLFLCFWYSLLPQLEWYTIWFSIIHILSISIILKYILFDCTAQKVIKVSFVLTTLTFEAFFICNFQFTTTSVLVSMAGFLMFLGYSKKHLVCIGLLLMVLGSQIRENSIFLVFLLCTPVFLRFVFTKNKKYLLIIAIIGVFFLNHKIDYWSYQKSSWSQFYDYRLQKASVLDNSNAPLYYKSLTNKAEANDFLLFLCNLYDKNVINYSQLKNIQTKLVSNDTFQLFKDLVNSFKSLVIGNNNILLTPIYCLFIFFFVLFLNGASLIDKISFLLIIYFFTFSICYIPLVLKLKLRVFISAIFILFILALFYSSRFKNLISQIVIIISLISLSNYIIRKTRDTRKYNYSKLVMFEKQRLLFDKMHNKIVPLGGAYSIECYPPFSVSKSLGEQKYYCMALIESPLNNNICNNFIDFVNGPLLFMDQQSSQSVPKMLIESIERHYSIKAKYRIVAQDSSNAIVQIYK